MKRIIFVLAILFSTATVAEDEKFFFSHDPSTIVIQWTAGGPAGRSSTTVYGDGSVRAVVAKGLTRAGTWEGRLTEEEFGSLLGRLVELGVFEFDTTRAKTMLTEKSSRCENTFVSNEDLQTLEIHLDELIAHGRSIAPFSKNVSWSNLHHDAERCPGAPELAKMAEAFALFFYAEKLTELSKVEE